MIRLVFVFAFFTQIVAIPIISSVKFVKFFEQIEIVFEENIDFYEIDNKCDVKDYFDTLGQAQIGGEAAQCIISTANTIYIIPGVNAKLRKNDILRFVENKTMQLTSSLDEPSPQLNINGPNSYCLCPGEEIYIDIDMSTGLGYGLLQNITWRIESTISPTTSPTEAAIASTTNAATSNPSTSNPSISNVTTPGTVTIAGTTATSTASLMPVTSSVAQQEATSSVAPSQSTTSTANLVTTPAPSEAELQAELDNQKGKTEITLSLGKLRTDRQYTVKVTGINVFGKMATASKTFQFNSKCSPHVTIAQGSNLVQDEPVTFLASVNYPKCYDMTGVPIFKWEVTLNDVPVNLNSAVTNRNIFVVRENTFEEHKDYKVSVTVTTRSIANEESVSSNHQMFEVHTHHAEIGVVGGDREISLNDILLIETFPKEGIDEDATFTWSCMDDTGNPCKNGDENLVLPSQKDLSLKMLEGSFVLGNVYTFKLTFTDEGEVIEDQVLVKIISGVDIQLVVAVQQHELTVVEPIVFTAKISGNLKTFKYEWLCYNAFDPRQASIKHVPAGKTVTVMNDEEKHQIRSFDMHYTGKIGPGYHLTCKCEVEMNGKSIKASDKISMFFPIQNAALSVSPAFGSPSQTIFRFRAYHWTAFESNQPLLFRFGYAEKDVDVFLTGWSTKNSVSGVRLSGTPETAKTIFVEMINAEHMITRVENSVELKALTLTQAVLEAELINRTHKFVDRDQFKASMYLDNYVTTNGLANLPMENLTDADMQTHFIHYIGLFMKTPATFATTENVIHLTETFMSKSNGKVSEGVFNRTIELIHFLTDDNFPLVEKKASIHKVKGLLVTINSFLEQPAYRDRIKPLKDGLLKKFSQYICSAIEVPSILNDFFETKNKFLNLKVKEEKFLLDVSSTVLTLSKNFTDTYTSWACSSTNSKCNGLCISEVWYERAMFDSYSNFSKEWQLVTDVYHVRLYKPIPPHMEIDTTRTSENYDIILPVATDADLAFDDNMQCQILDPETGGYDNMTCDNTKLVLNKNGDKEIHCNCQKLGKIAAFKQVIEIITTTELPYKGENISVSLYFYAPKSVCIFPNKYKFFEKKLRTGLAREFRISEDRITFFKCQLGSIIIPVHITDGEPNTRAKRNYNLKFEVLEFIRKEEFSVTMKAGTYPMFNVNKTTPKPPPPTIPPIGEVDTEWYPIGIAIAVVLFCFFLCAVTTWMVHTRLLKNKVFNSVNSNKREELTDAEELELADTKAREKKMVSILEEDAGDMVDGVDASTTSLSRNKKKRNNIHPVTDSNAFALDGSITRQSARLDSPRLALDDSSDEETPPSDGGSSAGLFLASSQASMRQNEFVDSNEPAAASADIKNQNEHESTSV